MNASELTRDQKLALIYRHTHKDYKGTIHGCKTIMVCRGSTTLVAMTELTDAEIADRLPAAIRKEEQRLAKKGEPS